MPYHAEGSLDERIRRHGPLPLDEALRLGVKMAGALETAHRLGILHRDVKPGNILLTDYGEPALTDFGIAHIAGGFETTAGVVTGSPAFTAPEVVAGDPPSPAADVYGIGATLFAAITGHAAFERRSGEQLVAQFLRITSEPVPNPREHGISEDISAAIERVMSAEAGARPSAVELGRQLRESQIHHGFPVDEMAVHAEPGATPSGGRCFRGLGRVEAVVVTVRFGPDGWTSAGADQFRRPPHRDGQCQERAVDLTDGDVDRDRRGWQGPPGAAGRRHSTTRSPRRCATGGAG